MKAITLISGFLFPFLMSYNQDKMIEATYDGYEDGVYYFTDSNDEMREFQSVEKSVLEKFDLMSKTLENKMFLVTFKEIVEEDEGDEEYTTYSITALKLKEE